MWHVLPLLAMMLNDTFKQYFSHTMAVSIIGGENQSTQRMPVTFHKLNIYPIKLIEYTSPWAGLELTTLVVIGTECICSLKLPCDHDDDGLHMSYK